MACASNSITIGLANYGLYAETRVLSPSYRSFPRKSSYKFLKVRSVQGNDGRQRLVDIIRIIPELSRNYFRSRSRRALFGGISLLGGFYVAQTISLSFGALGVNDVIAAALCVLLTVTEYVTKFYYSRPKGSTPFFLGLLLCEDWPIPGIACGVMIIQISCVSFSFHKINLWCAYRHTSSYLILSRAGFEISPFCWRTVALCPYLDKFPGPKYQIDGMLF